MTSPTPISPLQFCLHFLAAAIGATLAFPASAQAPDCSVERGSKIAASVEQAIRELPALSGQILVTHCGRQIVDRSVGLADRQSRVPVTSSTKFDSGSLTKQFVAAAILKLRDAGRLAATDPIRNYVAGLPGTTGAITIHQLLTHTSGLPMYSGEDYDPQTREGFVNWLRTTKLDRPPGTQYSYSNPGYSVLAHIVEQRSGRALENYLREQFFDRLGMGSTGYRNPKPPFAINYFADGRSDGTPVEKAWRKEGPFWNLYGNGGMLSTASDFRTWFDSLRSGRLLSERSTRDLFTRHATDAKDPKVGIGYGWRVIDDHRGRWINHGGSNGESFYTDVRYFERADALMIMSLNQFDLPQIQKLIRAFASNAIPGARPNP